MVNHSEATDLATIPAPPWPLNPSSAWTLLHPPPPLWLTLTVGCTLAASAACHFTGSLTDNQDAHEYGAATQTQGSHTRTHSNPVLCHGLKIFCFLKVINTKQIGAGGRAKCLWDVCVDSFMVHRRGQLYQFISIPGTLQTTLLHSQIM